MLFLNDENIYISFWGDLCSKELKNTGKINSNTAYMTQ